MTEPVVHQLDHMSTVTGYLWAVCGELVVVKQIGTVATNEPASVTCEHCKGMPRAHRSKYRDRHT